MCRKGAGEELTVVVPFMMLAQSRMHGLKKRIENGMIEPGVICARPFMLEGYYDF